MKTITILFATASLLATAVSASAGSFHYTGSPKSGQFYVPDQSDGVKLLGSRGDQLEIGRASPKGGIGSRGA